MVDRYSSCAMGQRAWQLISFGLVVGLLVGREQHAQSEAVTTDRITVVDAGGRERLTLGATTDGRFGLRLLDVTGAERAFVGLAEDEAEVALEMRGADGASSVLLRSVSDSHHGLFEQLMFGDSPGRPSVALSNHIDSSGFAVQDALGRKTIAWRSDELGRPSFDMRLSGAETAELGGPRPEGGFHVSLLGPQNRPSEEVMVSTWYGDSSAALTLSSDAPPKAEFFDKEGKLIRR